MTRYVFEPVHFRMPKAVNCAGCGKRLRRSKTFTRTVNPFNRRADGQPKSRAEVQADNIAEARTWLEQPERCIACQRLTR